MDTSKTIKQAQYQPHPVRKVGRGTWRTQSRDGSHEHTVRRDGATFRCDCPATSLCHHVTDLVMDLAREKGWHTVQVWTTEVDARRQKRQWARFRANAKPFWVTFAGKAEPEPQPVRVPDHGPRTVLVAFLWDRMEPPSELDRVLVPTRDVWVDDGDGWRPARAPLADIMDLDGWTYGRVTMRRGNERPGLHRFEFQMRRG